MILHVNDTLAVLVILIVCLFFVQRRLRRGWQPTGRAQRSGAWWSSVR